MNPLCTLNFSSSTKKNFEANNKINKSQSTNHFKKSHCPINCKSPIKTKEVEYVLVKSLWSDLGVNMLYQNEFKKYYNELGNDQQKMDLLILEKSHLRIFREVLIKLSEEITNRDNNIYNLKKYCKELENYKCSIDSRNNEIDIKDNNNNNFIETPSDILESIQKEIKSYKINTVNAINRMMIVREIASYYELNKKWDISNINRSYAFNQNYLLTMNKDIEFLNDSILLNYIQTEKDSKKSDLFFSNWKYLIINNKVKLRLSNSLELQNEINKCKYIILQDELLNKVKAEHKKLIKKQNNILSIKSPHAHNTAGNNVSTLSIKNQSEIFLANDKEEKKYYEMFGHNKINLSRALYYLKRTMGNKYEKLFYNENENELGNDKKNMKIMNKIFNFPLNDENDVCESYNENNSELNNINNRNYYLEYLNKNRWNCFHKTSNASSNNSKKELLNKKIEDLKIGKVNTFNEQDKRSSSVKKKKKIKKKQKKEKVEIIENNKDKKDESSKEKIKNKENEDNIKNKEKENLNKKEKEKEKENLNKKEKENKRASNKFESENTQIENTVSLSIIIENKKENDEETKYKEINDEKLNEKISEENQDENVENIKDRGKDSSENASKANEDNHISKVKLLRYRQYTAEEIKRFNSNYC